MSVSLHIEGFTGLTNEEYKKHYEALEYCLTRGLTPPVETLEFFEGKLGGCGVKELSVKGALDYAKKGTYVSLKDSITEIDSSEVQIDVSRIPKETEVIIVKIDW